MSANQLFAGLGQTALEVLQGLLPLMGILLLTPSFLDVPHGFIAKSLKGLLLTFIGLTLLLHGIHMGFFPAGQMIGEIVSRLPNSWVAIPIGALIGLVVAIAEPGLRVLAAQVEEASSGAIKQRIMISAVAGAVSLSVGLGMARIIYSIPLLYIILPGYLVLIFLLAFTEPSFSAIAFDAGVVVTGPMVVAFVLSLGIGMATTMPNGDPVTNGFGITALVALAPIVAVMLLGQIYKNKD